ncbi:MAG: hypothetical protein TREMPRED_001884 [Tremellales sp. Tagirdzhanova-0007]|nr:MAG: hypothetical protein TREMPRED_001884 [Tremellales sp. Tagirdzhanova-0007]
MRFSRAIDHFYLIPPAAKDYTNYTTTLLSIAQSHSATLFIPVSGAGSSVEDARAAEEMFVTTGGTCRTFIQDPETMLDLHDKDRFMALVDRLGMVIPSGRMVQTVDEAIDFLRDRSGSSDQHGPWKPKYVLKALGLDENRGDMTLFPLKGDDSKLSRTRAWLERLSSKISQHSPHVFQEYIPGQGEDSVSEHRFHADR